MFLPIILCLNIVDISWCGNEYFGLLLYFEKMQLKFQPSEELKSAKALISTFILFQAVGGYTPISKYEFFSAFSLKAAAILDIEFFSMSWKIITLFSFQILLPALCADTLCGLTFQASISPSSISASHSSHTAAHLWRDSKC